MSKLSEAIVQIYGVARNDSDSFQVRFSERQSDINLNFAYNSKTEVT